MWRVARAIWPEPRRILGAPSSPCLDCGGARRIPAGEDVSPEGQGRRGGGMRGKTAPVDLAALEVAPGKGSWDAMDTSPRPAPVNAAGMSPTVVPAGPGDIPAGGVGGVDAAREEGVQARTAFARTRRRRPSSARLRAVVWGSCGDSATLRWCQLGIPVAEAAGRLGLDPVAVWADGDHGIRSSIQWRLFS